MPLNHPLKWSPAIISIILLPALRGNHVLSDDLHHIHRLIYKLSTSNLPRTNAREIGSGARIEPMLEFCCCRLIQSFLAAPPNSADQAHKLAAYPQGSAPTVRLSADDKMC